MSAAEQLKRAACLTYFVSSNYCIEYIDEPMNMFYGLRSRQEEGTTHRIKPRLLAPLLLAAVYFAAGTAGLKFYSTSGFATYVWAPSGISLAALLIFGRWIWPGVALGAFLVNLSAGATTWAALGISLGNTLEALAAAVIMRTDPEFSLPLSRFKDVARFIFVAVPVGATISATLGWLSVRLSHPPTSILSNHDWTTWWVGNVLGALVIGPLAMTWWGSHRTKLAGPRLFEALLLGIMLTLVSGFVFLGDPGASYPGHPLAFATLPFIVLASMRFSLRGVVTTSFILSVIAIMGTLMHRGPFGGLPLRLGLYYLDTFMAVAISTGLLLASAILEREQYQETLKARQALQECIDGLSELIVKVDVAGRTFMVNRLALKESGLDSEPYLKTSLFSVPLWNYDSAVEERIRDAFKRAVQGKYVSYEETIKTSTRGMISTSFSLTPIYTSDLKVKYILIEAKDLSEQKGIEDQLRKSQMVLAEAQRITHIGSWEWDIKKDRITWSDELFKIYDIQADQFDSTVAGFLVKVHPDDREKTRQKVLDSINTGEPFHFEERIIRPGGGVRVLDSRGIAIKDEGGKVVRLLGTCQDITERKELELERATLLRREMKARQEAEASTRAKDMFLATLSHELRTPLTTILSWAQVLQIKEFDKEKTQKAYSMIEQSAKAQKQMIEDLLDVSRIIMGKLSLELQAVDPTAIVLAAVESLTHQVEEKGLRIETKLNHCQELVLADPTRLRQIIWNLLTNAIRFTPTGGKIWVELRNISDAKQSFVRILVKDTGKGISPQFVPHLFDLFVQANSSSTRVHGGLGMGLSIVKRLVELQLGKVSAQSDGLGKGSTFTVDLPALEGRDLSRMLGKESATNLQSIRTGLKGRHLQGLKVLLVDDDVGANEAIAQSLIALGAHVEAASSAQKALEKLTHWVPDVLVSDIAMPEEDGYSLIRRVRILPDRRSHIPAIALSAYAEKSDREKAISSGYQAHLSKPVDIEVLAQTIGQFVNPKYTFSESA